MSTELSHQLAYINCSISSSVHFLSHSLQPNMWTKVFHIDTKLMTTNDSRWYAKKGLFFKNIFLGSSIRERDIFPNMFNAKCKQQFYGRTIKMDDRNLMWASLTDAIWIYCNKGHTHTHTIRTIIFTNLNQQTTK